jgi:hypothetical protein
LIKIISKRKSASGFHRGKRQGGAAAPPALEGRAAAHPCRNASCGPVVFAAWRDLSNKFEQNGDNQAHILCNTK